MDTELRRLSCDTAHHRRLRTVAWAFLPTILLFCDVLFFVDRNAHATDERKEECHSTVKVEIGTTLVVPRVDEAEKINIEKEEENQ